MSEAKRLKLEAPVATLTPILGDELCAPTPLVDVYVATIKNPRTTSRIVKDLNSCVPIPELMHLKRVKKSKILLFPTSVAGEASVVDYLRKKGFDFSLLEAGIDVVKVAAMPPKIRKQYDVVHELWPCNFHANSYLEKLSTNTLFTTCELSAHVNFMKMAIDVCKIAGVAKGTVVVDPIAGSVVAFGFDQRETCPTRHSVMVAVDAVARTQNGGVWPPHEAHDKIETFLGKKYALGRGPSEDAYLCTGYVVYTTHEPCITCAMALVHSRVKRVFYGARTPKGALGSGCKIHVVENLNHHYEAFAGLLEEECDSL